MQDTFKSNNVKYVTNTNLYNIDCKDDIINVDTSVYAVTLYLPNIVNSGIALFPKQFTINDISGNAGTNNITIMAADNTVNGASSKVLSQDGVSCAATPCSQTEWLVNSDDQTSRQAPLALTDGATITWPIRSSYNAWVVLAGNRTLAITGLIKGDYGTIEIYQDAVGSRTLILPAGSKVGNSGAGLLGLSTTANALDIATFYYNHNGILCFNITNSFT